MASVLVIDDEPSVALTLTRMLRFTGHTVDCAPTADAGLERIASACPDAVLLDIRMPQMTGVELLRRLRAIPGAVAVPVAVVTGDYFLNEQVLAELGSLGARVYYKPLAIEDLDTLMASLLGPRDAAPARP